MAALRKIFQKVEKDRDRDRREHKHTLEKKSPDAKQINNSLRKKKKGIQRKKHRLQL